MHRVLFFAFTRVSHLFIHLVLQFFTRLHRRQTHTYLGSVRIICFTRIDFYINFLCLGLHVCMQSQ